MSRAWAAKGLRLAVTGSLVTMAGIATIGACIAGGYLTFGVVSLCPSVLHTSASVAKSALPYVAPGVHHLRGLRQVPGFDDACAWARDRCAGVVLHFECCSSASTMGKHAPAAADEQGYVPFFEAAAAFEGARSGAVFKLGTEGLAITETCASSPIPSAVQMALCVLDVARRRVSVA